MSKRMCPGTGERQHAQCLGTLCRHCGKSFYVYELAERGLATRGKRGWTVDLPAHRLPRGNPRNVPRRRGEKGVAAP